MLRNFDHFDIEIGISWNQQEQNFLFHPSYKWSLTSLFSACAWQIFEAFLATSNQELWPITAASAPNPLGQGGGARFSHSPCLNQQWQLKILLTLHSAPIRVLCTTDFHFYLSHSNRVVSCSPAALPLCFCQFASDRVGHLLRSVEANMQN